MNLIKEIEIRYFRSIYTQKIQNINDMTVFFGKNDSGKSNYLRALNLFFNDNTNPGKKFEFSIDFNHARLIEVSEKEDARKFVSIKITFNTPSTWQKSLGKEFYVKKLWSITRQVEPIFENSISDPKKLQYLTRFLSAVKFHYVPAIKDRSIFEKLLEDVYKAISYQVDFQKSLETFSKELKSNTDILSKGIKENIEISSNISPPTDLTELFRSLDFETSNKYGDNYSLTNQRGDGIQVRHIPAILAFLSDTGNSDFHIWGFEEPENSLELALAVEESKVFSQYSESANKQIFVTSHSPAFFALRNKHIKRLFVMKRIEGILKRETSTCTEVKNDDSDNPSDLMGETPHLSVISSYLERSEKKVKQVESDQKIILETIQSMRKPILFVEGESDKKIIGKAWELYIGKTFPYKIEECSGTTKMESLACDGKALQAIAPRKIYVIVDNDKEGKDLYKNARLQKEGGVWVEHNSNKTKWCRLPWHNEFKTIMKKTQINENYWPLCIENMIEYSIRDQATKEKAYKVSEMLHNEIHVGDPKNAVRYIKSRNTNDEYYYVMDIDFDYKIKFADWLVAKSTKANGYLKNLEKLVLSLNDEIKGTIS
jgi:predicted ATPase